MAETDILIQNIGRNAMIPYYFSRIAIGAFRYYMGRLEKSITTNNNADVSRYRKATLKAGKDAVKIGNKCPYPDRIPTAHGEDILAYQQTKKGIKWFERSVEEGERLGARPDLSRTYLEVGKRLSEPKSKYNHLNGITAEECLEKARVIFD